MNTMMSRVKSFNVF